MAAWDYPLPGPNFQGQPDYAATMADILSSPGRTLRGTQESDRDYAAKMQQLADQKAYQEGQLAVDRERNATLGTDKYGTTIYVDTDKQGNLHPFVMGKGGDKKYLPANEGMTYAPKLTPLDTGTGYTPFNPYSPGTPITKDVAAAAAEKAKGEGAGAAAVNLPVVEEQARKLTEDIDSLLADKDALKEVTGPFLGGGYWPTWAQGAEGQRAQSKIDKILGDVFLQGYAQLRGAGAITQDEGARAAAAYSRLKTQSLGDADYLDAVQELKAGIDDMVAAARRKAAGTAAPAAPAPPGTPAPPAPAGGSTAAPLSVEQWLGGG